MKASIGAVMRLRQAGISTEYVSIEAVGDITSYFKYRAFDAMIEVIDGRVVSTRVLLLFYASCGRFFD